MVREIAQIGNPVLRAKTEEVAPADIGSSEIQTLVDDLIETKRAVHGAGLAAPQVSVPLRIFMVEVGDNPRYPYKPRFPLTVVINPEISFLTDERFDNYEGCLSVPNLRGIVERCPEIKVEGLDRQGKPIDMVVRGITAGSFQHEYDHLDGVLFTDRVKDTKTLCTWEEFKKHHESDFREHVERIRIRYGS